MSPPFTYVEMKYVYRNAIVYKAMELPIFLHQINCIIEKKYGKHLPSKTHFKINYIVRKQEIVFGDNTWTDAVDGYELAGLSRECSLNNNNMHEVFLGQKFHHLTIET